MSFPEASCTSRQMKAVPWRPQALRARCDGWQQVVEKSIGTRLLGEWSWIDLHWMYYLDTRQSVDFIWFDVYAIPPPDENTCMELWVQRYPWPMDASLGQHFEPMRRPGRHKLPGTPKIEMWNTFRMAEHVWLNCQGPTWIQWCLKVSSYSP